MADDATRKAAERQRKKAAGLVRIEEWVPADDADRVRAYAAYLRRLADARAYFDDGLDKSPPS